MTRWVYRMNGAECAALLLLAGKPGGAPPRSPRAWYVLWRTGLIERTGQTQWTPEGTRAWRITDDGLAVVKRIEAA